MGNSVTLSAHFVRNSADYVPSLTAGRTPLCVDVGLAARGEIPADAELVLKARELFAGAAAEWRSSLSELPRQGEPVKLAIPAEALPLEPGCWHIVVDLLSDGESLAGLDVGSTVAYARRPDESLLHARGSYSLARLAFALDRKADLFTCGWQEELPPTGDPFYEKNEERHRHEFIRGDSTWPELQHDGGLGLLLSAFVYHALGDESRVAYCEQAMRRIVRMITEIMPYGDGRLGTVLGREKDWERTGHCKQQDSFAMKFLAQTALYFRFGPGDDKDYARHVLEQARSIFDYQMTHHLVPGCGECDCCVYDGRVLAGICWYCLAHKAEHGAFPEIALLHKVIVGADDFSRHVLANRGWYDAGCLVEGKCHIWCGNMNLLNALLPARRIMDQGRPRYSPDDHCNEAIREAFRFLTSTNSAITGQTAFVPSAFESPSCHWAAGNMYELCDEFLRQLGDDPGVRQLRDYLVPAASQRVITCIHGCNAAGALLMHSDEYQGLAEKPGLPWDRIDWGNVS